MYLILTSNDHINYVLLICFCCWTRDYECAQLLFLHFWPLSHPLAVKRSLAVVVHEATWRHVPVQPYKASMRRRKKGGEAENAPTVDLAIVGGGTLFPLMPWMRDSEMVNPPQSFRKGVSLRGTGDPEDCVRRWVLEALWWWWEHYPCSSDLIPLYSRRSSFWLSLCVTGCVCV